MFASILLKKFILCLYKFFWKGHLAKDIVVWKELRFSDQEKSFLECLSLQCLYPRDCLLWTSETKKALLKQASHAAALYVKIIHPIEWIGELIYPPLAVLCGHFQSIKPTRETAMKSKTMKKMELIVHVGNAICIHICIMHGYLICLYVGWFIDNTQNTCWASLIWKSEIWNAPNSRTFYMRPKSMGLSILDLM